eukprot:gene33452-42937_t
MFRECIYALKDVLPMKFPVSDLIMLDSLAVDFEKK